MTNNVIKIQRGRPSEIGAYIACVPTKWGGAYSEGVAHIGAATLSGHLLVAYMQNQVTGILAWSENVYSSALSIGPICIPEKWRRKGVATALIGSLEAIARDNGFRRIFVEYYNNGVDPFILTMFDTLGYKECGRVGYMHSESVESIILSKSSVQLTPKVNA